MNNKGNVYVLFFFIIILLTAMVAIFAVGLGSGVVTYISDELDTATADMGMVHETNMTHVQEVTIGTANTSVQMLTWLSGVAIAFIILGTLLFSYYVRTSPSTFMIGAFLLMMVLLVVTSIMLSNIYEEVYNGTDEIALQLQSMTMASFLIIHLPLIISGVAFVGGIILFSGMSEEEYT